MSYLRNFGAAVDEGCTLDSLKAEHRTLVLHLVDVLLEETGKGYAWPVTEASAFMAECISELPVSEEEKLSLYRIYLRTIDEAYCRALIRENGSQP